MAELITLGTMVLPLLIQYGPTVGGTIASLIASTAVGKWATNKTLKKKQLKKLLKYVTDNPEEIVEDLTKTLSKMSWKDLNRFYKLLKQFKSQFKRVSKDDFVFLRNFLKILTDEVSLKDFMKKQKLCKKLAKITCFSKLDDEDLIKSFEQKYLEIYLSMNLFKLDEECKKCIGVFTLLKERINLYNLSKLELEEQLSMYMPTDGSGISLLIQQDCLNVTYNNLSSVNSFDDILEEIAITVEEVVEKKPVLKRRLRGKNAFR